MVLSKVKTDNSYLLPPYYGLTTVKETSLDDSVYHIVQNKIRNIHNKLLIANNESQLADDEILDIDMMAWILILGRKQLNELFNTSPYCLSDASSSSKYMSDWLKMEIILVDIDNFIEILTYL